MVRYFYVCVDYRKLNENTVRSSFYFPEIGEIFDKLGGNNFFSTLDMQKGYYQVKMSDKSIKKLPFRVTKLTECLLDCVEHHALFKK